MRDIVYVFTKQAELGYSLTGWVKLQVEVFNLVLHTLVQCKIYKVLSSYINDESRSEILLQQCIEMTMKYAENKPMSMILKTRWQSLKYPPTGYSIYDKSMKYYVLWSLQMVLD